MMHLKYYVSLFKCSSLFALVCFRMTDICKLFTFMIKLGLRYLQALHTAS